MKELAWQLAELGRYFYKRGWALGTSGNFSAVVQLDPIHLIISQSSIDKGELSSEHMLLIDESLKVIGEKVAKPSDESLLHIEIVRSCGAKVVLHT
ncbi:MAG: class II aldolase/adducin family protein, partial [Blastocatellia bacterium]|nr:class II aldolase/adducin family protein [Blastocatellia bacterium]